LGNHIRDYICLNKIEFQVVKMVKRSRGFRSKTRKKLRKRPRERGLSSITKTFQEFEVGEHANIIINPSIHKGQPHPRFHGLTGTIIGTQGEAYVLTVKVGKKDKELIIRPEHLKKIPVS
jgi:large subunit ribosomal protein L21e